MQLEGIMLGILCLCFTVSGLTVIFPHSLKGIYSWRSAAYGPSAFDHLQYNLTAAYPDISDECNHINLVNGSAVLANANHCPPVRISLIIQYAGGEVAIIGMNTSKWTNERCWTTSSKKPHSHQLFYEWKKGPARKSPFRSSSFLSNPLYVFNLANQNLHQNTNHLTLTNHWLVRF